jgi:ParB family chromosome partitioning protein
MRVRLDPHQPRQTFDEAALDQLAQSIRQDGVMQPIVVRPHPSTRRKGKYQLVAGERRLLAARRVGLAVIPAIVRRLDDQKLAEWAVIENLQREDLNPIERAEAFNRLIDRFRLSHQQVADRVGVNRPTISNFLRILDLHKDVRELVRSGQLSGGHARALLGLSDAEAQLQLAKKATAGAWSVRAVERAVRQAQRAAEPASSQKGSQTPGSRSAHRADLKQQAAEQLGTKVRIKPGRKKNSGTLSIEFYDLDQFARLMQALGVNIE